MGSSHPRAFLAGAWRQLPVETVVVAMAALGAIAGLHDTGSAWCMRVVLASVLVLPLALAAHRLGRRAQVIVIAPVSAGVLVAMWVAVPDLRALDLERFTWPFGLALLAAMLVPFVSAGRGLHRFVRRFFEETTTWGLLWLCAMAALAVIAIALDGLFELRVDRLGGDAAIALTAGFVLVYVDRMVADERSAAERVPELWRRLAIAIGAPFVSIMLAILVVYEITSAARGALPRNALSPLILASGFVGFVSTLIISSVVGEGRGEAVLVPADHDGWTRRWTVRLTRAFPLVLCALLPMACWALWRRVDEYGVTPFRAARGFGLACLATLSLGGAVRWFRGRPALAWEVPAAILAFALAAAFGPFSVVRLSVSSQARALAHLLDEAGVARTVDPSQSRTPVELAAPRLARIKAALEALVRLGGEPAIREVLDGPVAECTRRWVSQDCLAQLGLASRDEPAPRIDILQHPGRERYELTHGQLAFVDLGRAWGAPARTPGMNRADGELELSLEAVVLYTGDGELARAPLGELVAIWRRDGVLPSRAIPLVSPGGATVAELAVQRLELEGHAGSEPQITRLIGAVLWRR